MRIERVNLGEEIYRTTRKQDQTCGQDRERDPLDPRAAQRMHGEIGRERKEERDQSVQPTFSQLTIVMLGSVFVSRAIR